MKTSLAYDILIADDHAPLRAVMEDCLGAQGYRVRAVANGKAAKELLAAHSVRLVVTDIFMPESDGLELVMHLRRAKPQPAVLAISGGDVAEPELFLRAARHMGVHATLEKPFTVPVLLAEVRRLIGAPADTATAGTQA
jgi:CheY-like chemotaxis protein